MILGIPTWGLTLKKTIYGNISPKSIVYSGDGLFFAQNMMYRHTITVYNKNYKLVKTISDRVKLSAFGFNRYKGFFRGSPVEAAFSHNGQYAWVSNYQISGHGFRRPGNDRGGPSGKYDSSFVYRINTRSLAIENVIKVGSVPKFVAVTPDNSLVLVSNWCSWNLSIIDTEQNREIKKVKLGRFPRGIAVNQTSDRAYVAVMGTFHIADLDLNNYSVKWIRNVGRSPRHLNIDPSGEFLYATLNGEGKVAKIDLKSRKTVKKITTGRAPRSMVITDDGSYLYIVNYKSDSMSKVRTRDMKLLKSVKTNHHPIGITYNPINKEIWVACYSGSIMIFTDY